MAEFAVKVLVDSLNKSAADLEAKHGLSGINSASEKGDKLNADSEKDDPAETGDSSLASIMSICSEFETVLTNPKSLAPAGGCFAFCAASYAGSVQASLKKLSDEAVTVKDSLAAVPSEIKGAKQKVMATVQADWQEVRKQIQELCNIPAEIRKIADAILADPNNLLNADVGPLKECLDVSPALPRIANMASLKDEILPTIKDLVAKSKGTQSFGQSAPGRLRNALQPGSPCGCRAPVPKTAEALLQNLEDFGPTLASEMDGIVSYIQSVDDSVENFDANAVLGPLKQAAQDASDVLDKVIEELEQAKSAGQVAAGIGSAIGAFANRFG